MDEARRSEKGRLAGAIARLAGASAPTPDGLDLAERRDLNNGFGNALAKAFELAATPALFGFLGWLLDRWVGTAPLFLVSFIVIVFVYEVWKLFLGYGADMDEQQARLLGRATPSAPPPANPRRIEGTSAHNASRVRGAARAREAR